MGAQGESIRMNSRSVDRAVEEEEAELHVEEEELHRLGHAQGSVPSRHVAGRPEACKCLEDPYVARRPGAVVEEEWPVLLLSLRPMVEEVVADVKGGPARLG
ncbi:hypothetical protein lerEdw1_015816 [Lerista edwardsae]|nr:hypothetical protein lerEdw1_015816 [Lerista edwardsae]